MNVTLDESDRQMILLGLARLAIERPGWDYCIGEIAEKLHGRAMILEFKRTYTPARLPVAIPESDCTDTIKDGLIKRNEYERVIGGLQPDVSDQPGDNGQGV